MGQAKEKGVGCLWIYPFVAAENVEGCVAKGILISPMYIYNKNAAAYWGVGGVCNLKLWQLLQLMRSIKSLL